MLGAKNKQNKKEIYSTDTAQNKDKAIYRGASYFPVIYSNTLHYFFNT